MENYFKDVDLFLGLSESDQKLLSSFCQAQWFSDGQYICEQGDEAQAMYLIRSWEVRVIKDDEIIVTLWKGNIIGEMALLQDNEVRNATLQAAGDVELITIIRFSIDQMFAKYPKLQANIQGIIESRK